MAKKNEPDLKDLKYLAKMEASGRLHKTKPKKPEATPQGGIGRILAGFDDKN